ncbi:MAG: hypothetical protein ABI596_12215 [Pyrinomonadaceae bacterium]
MTKHPSVFFVQKARHARLLAGLLLVLILHGGTSSLIHTHRSALASRTTQSASTANSFTIAQSGAPGTSPSCFECLICQLQQNLTLTVLGKAPRLDAQLFYPAQHFSVTIFCLTEPLKQGHGRAPPLTSLV